MGLLGHPRVGAAALCLRAAFARGPGAAPCVSVEPPRCVPGTPSRGSSPVCVNSRRATDSVLVLGGPCSPRYSLAPGPPFFPSLWHRCAHLQGPKALLKEGSRSSPSLPVAFCQHSDPSWGDWPWGRFSRGTGPAGTCTQVQMQRRAQAIHRRGRTDRDVDGTGRDRQRCRWCLP